MTNQSEFVVGDTVRLKCGGAEMVVAKLPSEGHRTVYCRWHVNGEPRDQEYEPETLDVVRRPGHRQVTVTDPKTQTTSKYWAR